MKPTELLRDILSEGVRRFNFTKLDGTVREALGTRCVNLIPKDEYVKHVEDINSKKAFVYWDLESQGFRSFSVNSDVKLC